LRNQLQLLLVNNWLAPSASRLVAQCTRENFGPEP